MKCLSVSQPFADLIVLGKKTVELRRWNTSFRGEFLVQAPLKIKKDDCKRLKINPKKLVTGAIVGKAKLYDVKKYSSRYEVKADSKKHLASASFHDRRYGFQLKNAKAFRIPIPCKGQLGFFDVKLPKQKIKTADLITEFIDEEQRYRLVGHH